jgi:glycosyltransferase involved in cell wall biosynthesis
MSQAEAAAKPTIAVLLSTYNGEKYLDAQLSSLAAQEGVRCEVFARDDGSTDESLAILRRYSDRWPQLARLTSGPNVGAALSFLELLRTAPEGFDYYAFCDQDDVWLPGKLARAAEHLAGADPTTPAAYCSQVVCADADLNAQGEPLPAALDPSFEHLVFECFAIGMTMVMNPRARDLVVRHIPKAGVVMHDWWCALTAAALGTLIYDPLPLVLYRQHVANVYGARTDSLSAIVYKLRRLLRDPSSFHPIRGQAAALLETFGAELAPGHQRLLERLVASKRSLGARISYAFTGPVVRSRWLDVVFLRGMILVGWY